MKWKKKKLDFNSVIRFHGMHPKYGHAEFQFCFVYKYGKLRELFIYPRQQENPEGFYYHLPFGDYKPKDFLIEAYGNEDRPRSWIYGWCDIHKCVLMNVYTPNNTNRIRFETLSTFQVNFENHNTEKEAK